MKRRVFILGAGASAAPRFAGQTGARMPLVSDFFSLSEGIRFQQDYRPLWKYAERLGVSWEGLLEGRPNVEELFTAFDVLVNRPWRQELPSDDELAQMDVAVLEESGALDFWGLNARDYLVSFIFDTLSLASARLVEHQCETHRHFVSKLLRGDTIISLNYDLILDASLAASGRWTPYDGYGIGTFRLAHGVHKEGLEKLEMAGILPRMLRFLDVGIAVPEPIPNGSDVLLLKPHGSLNWWSHFVGRPRRSGQALGPPNVGPTEFLALLSTEDTFRLVGRLLGPGRRLEDEVREKWPRLNAKQRLGWLHSRRTNTPLGRHEGVYLVPPTMQKPQPNEDSRAIREVWALAAVALAEASDVYVVGYSLPVADYTIRVLLAESAAKARMPPTITIVNPRAEQVLSEFTAGGIVPAVRFARPRHQTFDEFVSSM